MRRIVVGVVMMMVMSIMMAPGMTAQRRVTPVDTPATATQPVNELKVAGDSIDRSRLMEITDSKGNKVLIDTVTGREVPDTFAVERPNVPKMIYPLLRSVTFSVDVFQLAMRAFGQKHGLAGIGAEINLHNRYIPVVEVGLGEANSTPDDNNFTYRSSLSPYFKIGMNYNFLYNSNPDYMVYAGIRYGFSPFKFKVDNVSQPGGYWDDPVSFAIPEQSVTASYLEFMLGLRVKIVSNFSIGWSVRYHSLLSDGATPYGKPWYVPGFGTRGTSFNADLSLSYTIPLRRRAPQPALETAAGTTSADIAQPDGTSDSPALTEPE